MVILAFQDTLNHKAVFKGLGGVFSRKYWFIGTETFCQCVLFPNSFTGTIFTKKKKIELYSSQHKNLSITYILIFGTLFGDVRKFT